MTHEQRIEKLRDVVRQATEDAGELHLECLAGVVDKASTLTVCYRSGNEYLRLDKLLKALKEVGDVVLVEFRGRGREPAERTHRLVAMVRHDGAESQIVFEMP